MQNKIVSLDSVVIKFAGDSGDGMQFTGLQFSDVSAFSGNDISTFPDFPSEIRAPEGTIGGVSGFQVNLGHREVYSPGDLADVLVAMNPAALRANMRWVRNGAQVVIDTDSFDDKHFEKAGFCSNPLEDGTFAHLKLIHVPVTSRTRAALVSFDLDARTADKIKNQFISGFLFWLFCRSKSTGEQFISERLVKKTKLLEPNLAVFRAGYAYAETESGIDTRFEIKPAVTKKGRFKNMTGNTAVAFGLAAGAERAGRKLFLGSYPITPATEILQELSKFKHLGVVSFQAEDEIAGICSAIGASYAGNMGVTTTSGPGLALKGEAIGLAVMTELPLVIVNVQRGGPSTGLPTKTEQADLLQALYGRNGESPCVVVAAKSPADCFHMSYLSVKIAIEYMTPVILLSDGYIANSSELFPVPEIAKLPAITPRLVKDNDPAFKPYLRDEQSLARSWAIPGQEGLRHRVGGLEKMHISGEVSHDPANHERMVNLRAQKVNRVVDQIPNLDTEGETSGDLLVVGWGGTYGALKTAVKNLHSEGCSISLAHFQYIMPLPANTAEVFSRFKQVVVCELNLGQFASHLRSQVPGYKLLQYNKVQGLPFQVTELENQFRDLLSGTN